MNYLVRRWLFRS